MVGDLDPTSREPQTKINNIIIYIFIKLFLLNPNKNKSLFKKETKDNNKLIFFFNLFFFFKIKPIKF